MAVKLKSRFETPFMFIGDFTQVEDRDTVIQLNAMAFYAGIKEEVKKQCH